MESSGAELRSLENSRDSFCTLHIVPFLFMNPIWYNKITIFFRAHWTSFSNFFWTLTCCVHYIHCIHLVPKTGKWFTKVHLAKKNKKKQYSFVDTASALNIASSPGRFFFFRTDAKKRPGIDCIFFCAHVRHFRPDWAKRYTVLFLWT